jgi:hypothetical protein
MKRLGIFLGFGLALAATAQAQSNPLYAFSSPSVSVTAPSAPASASAAQPFRLFAFNAAPAYSSAPTSSSISDTASLPAAPQPPTPAPPPQDVQGVYQNYSGEAYIGYTYVRFFEVPGSQYNTNGFNFSVQYYLRDWFGLDGEFVSTFGSQLGETSHYLLGVGGIRIRKAGPYGTELWAHMLGGAGKYLPQTSFGSQNSLAYELGGGVDLQAHSHRIAYRLAIDAAGTNYFNTYQVSPKVSVGVVFKF